MNKTTQYVVLVFLLIAPFCFNNCYAQTTSSNDEIWPELDVLYKVSNKFRLMTLISGTKRESQYADGSFAAYVDYFTLPLLRESKNKKDSTRGYYQWFRLGYTYGSSTGNEDDAFKEHTINMESNTRFHLPFQFLATAKSRLDVSIFNGDLTARYRPRLTVERDCKTEYLTFTTYAYGEYFFDFNTSTQNKFRICLGAELWVSKIISFEMYYLKQFQGGQSGADVNALGVALKFNFIHKRKMTEQQEKEPEARIRSK